MKLKNLILLITLIILVNCNSNDETELIGTENTLETQKLFDPGDDSFDGDEQIIALISYDVNLKEDAIVAIRNSFLTSCLNPIEIGCIDDLVIEMYAELPNLPYTEYWRIKRCGDVRKIQCPNGVKDGIEDAEGIGNVE